MSLFLHLAGLVIFFIIYVLAYPFWLLFKFLSLFSGRKK